MSLHLIQFNPDMARLVRWAAQQKVLPQDAEDDLGYALHALLAAVFDSLRPKPFALLTDPRKPASVLAYSPYDGAALAAHALAFSLPDAAAALGLDGMAHKQMPDRFAAGRRLGFSVRVRPTVRVDRDSKRDAVREMDAFLAAARGTDAGVAPPRDLVYRDWLESRLQQGGASVEAVRMTSFQLAPVYRRDVGRRLRRQLGPDASFAGQLSVRDPDAFAALLARGVGRHRAFGFGMLLLRPA